MTQYMVAIQLPDDFDPSTPDEATANDIHALNREMIAAGVRTFVCGIEAAGKAKSLRRAPDGEVSITDGPFTEAKEHIGGFWVLDVADLEAALAWARKAAVACRAPVEVRKLLTNPPPPTTAPGAKS